MRIIDSNKDYYDYYQTILPDPTFTFDRRGSINLTKETFARLFRYATGYFRLFETPKTKDDRYILIQVGHNFWLLLLHITAYNKDLGTATDYTLKLLRHWKDYDSKRELIKCYAISFDYTVYTSRQQSLEDPKFLDRCQAAIKNGKARFAGPGDGDICPQGIPILKDTGIPSVIPPQDIYIALEEYFSLNKTDSERSESVNLTNNEKIVNHGFDVKTSFRGK